MTKHPDTARGGCLCGATRYECDGPPFSVIWCHCTSCRKHSGAPAVALAGYLREQVRWVSEIPRRYASSPGVERGFCANCGTPMTWEGDGGEMGPLVEILIGTLDKPDTFVPEEHQWDAERVAWFDTADTLPRYQEFHDETTPPLRHGPAI